MALQFELETKDRNGHPITYQYHTFRTLEERLNYELDDIHTKCIRDPNIIIILDVYYDHLSRELEETFKNMDRTMGLFDWFQQLFQLKPKIIKVDDILACTEEFGDMLMKRGFILYRGGSND